MDLSVGLMIPPISLAMAGWFGGGGGRRPGTAVGLSHIATISFDGCEDKVPIAPNGPKAGKPPVGGKLFGKSGGSAPVSGNDPLPLAPPADSLE